MSEQQKIVLVVAGSHAQFERELEQRTLKARVVDSDGYSKILDGVLYRFCPTPQSMYGHRGVTVEYWGTPPDRLEEFKFQEEFVTLP
jgi:hypothetical protein